MLALLVLVAVYALIVVGRLGPLRLAIWQAMLLGAALVLALGAISPAEAWAAVNWDVLAFLFGAFVVAGALEVSGALETAAVRLLARVRRPEGLLVVVLFALGGSAALLVNDAVAVAGVPMLLAVARASRVPPQPLLLALCFGVTIGSTPTPIGNPQNLIIASQVGFEHPFADFASRLGLPTLANLGAAYLVLRLAYAGEMRGFRPLDGSPPVPRRPRMARLGCWGVAAMLAVIAVRIVGPALGAPIVPLAVISLAGAAVVLPFTDGRREVLRRVDWGTLALFVGMFVLMQAVWSDPIMQGLLSGLGGAAEGAAAVPAVLATGVLGSQVVSNVPLVALALPGLTAAGAGQATLLALAAGSTLAGNLAPLGAASNLIVMQGAQARGVRLSVREFCRAGVPLTLLNLAITYPFLVL